MTVAVRFVTLSPSADELLVKLAQDAKIDPDIFGALLLENAVRERHELERRFAAALAKVANGA